MHDAFSDLVEIRQQIVTLEIHRERLDEAILVQAGLYETACRERWSETVRLSLFGTWMALEGEWRVTQDTINRKRDEETECSIATADQRGW
jgi:hypothetical protein